MEINYFCIILIDHSSENTQQVKGSKNLMKITKIASDLNEKCENRYALVYRIAELAKKLVDETNQRKHTDDIVYGGEQSFKTSIKPVIQSIMMIASESDDLGDELIG